MLCKKQFAAALAALALTACAHATPYQEESYLNQGGYVTMQKKDRFGKPIDDAWTVGFDGDQFDSLETAQVYTFYRCATLALEKGYDGFEVTSVPRTADTSTPNPLLQHAQVIIIPVPSGPSTGGTGYRWFTVEIKLLKKPFEARPPKVFNAMELKASLEPHVFGQKCEKGNVCPFAHDYLGSLSGGST